MADGDDMERGALMQQPTDNLDDLPGMVSNGPQQGPGLLVAAGNTFDMEGPGDAGGLPVRLPQPWQHIAGDQELMKQQQADAELAVHLAEMGSSTWQAVQEKDLAARAADPAGNPVQMPGSSVPAVDAPDGAAAPVPAPAPTPLVVGGLHDRRPADAWGVLKPDGRFRVGWDAWMAVVLLIIALVVPFQIGFAVDLIEYSLHWWIWTAVDIYFWTDIILNFNTGIEVDDGTIEMDRCKIFARYTKGWFLVDLVGCLPLRYFVDDTNGGGGYKLVKMVRLLRLAKLFRLARFRTTLNDHAEQLYTMQKTGKVVAAMTMMMFLSHWVGCFWFWIGTLGQDGAIGRPGGWIEAAGITQETNRWEMYQISIYWSITTLSTVGFGDISPKLPAERTVSCIASMFGVLLLATLMGYLGDAVAAAPLLEQDTSERRNRLLEFLRDTVPDDAELRQQVRDALEPHLERLSFRGVHDQAYDGSEIPELLPDLLRERVWPYIHRTPYPAAEDAASVGNPVGMESAILELQQMLANQEQMQQQMLENQEQMQQRMLANQEQMQQQMLGNQEKMQQQMRQLQRGGLLGRTSSSDPELVPRAARAAGGATLSQALAAGGGALSPTSSTRRRGEV